MPNINVASEVPGARLEVSPSACPHLARSAPICGMVGVLWWQSGLDAADEGSVVQEIAQCCSAKGSVTAVTTSSIATSPRGSQTISK